MFGLCLRHRDSWIREISRSPPLCLYLRARGLHFGLDQQFSYQFTTSPNLWHARDREPSLSNAPRFAAHSATYLIPLSWRDGIDLFGTYVKRLFPSRFLIKIFAKAYGDHRFAQPYNMALHISR